MSSRKKLCIIPALKATNGVQNRSIVYGLNSVFVKLFRKTILTLLVVIYSQVAFAAHVKGGYIQYTYNGVGSTTGTSNYTITVTVFFSCTVQGPRASVYLGIFNASTDALGDASQTGEFPPPDASANTVTKTRPIVPV